MVPRLSGAAVAIVSRFFGAQVACMASESGDKGSWKDEAQQGGEDAQGEEIGSKPQGKKRARGQQRTGNR